MESKENGKKQVPLRLSPKLYAAIAAASFVFIYACLPETRGRSLEDMEELFHTK